MRVLLTGGGTAGHINPALAIADVIRRNAPASEIAFVGVRGGREEDLIPREGYPLYFVESIGFARPIWHPKNLRAWRLALRSPKAPETQKILDEFQPDLVIGTRSGDRNRWVRLLADHESRRRSGDPDRGA